MRAFIVNNSVGKSTSNRRITRAFVIAQNGGHAMEVVRDLVDKLNLVQDNHHFGASDIGQMDHAPAEPVHVYESGSVIVYNLFEPMIAVKGVSSVKPSPEDQPAAAAIKQDPPKPANPPQTGQAKQQRKPGDTRK